MGIAAQLINKANLPLTSLTQMLFILFGIKTASFATKHPIISVVVILLIIGPTVYFHQQKLNFDTIGELGDSFDLYYFLYFYRQ
ncbi:hypothetical protein KPL39_10785 [Clostridium gasigenes]|uniref:hypothetical protein n=1 Tax=Clostridium gasigenes TaxID=94869 RepID=UPI001C0C44B9|nr:hypothetical protein [Clostridium gasigenes]MBU3136751.1 hypothetical protein [Clostridium gasigenes]